MSSKGELTGKQRAFIDAWFGAARFNGTEAARLAGYGGDENALGAAACRLLKNVKIKDEIDRRWQMHGMGADEVMAGWAEMARGDMADFLYFAKNGGYAKLDLDKAREAGKLRLIKSIAWTKGGVKIELYSAKDAYDSIARSLGMFKDQSTNLNIDLSQLPDEQVERIAKGENPLVVLASASRAGETAAPSKAE